MDLAALIEAASMRDEERVLGCLRSMPIGFAAAKR